MRGWHEGEEMREGKTSGQGPEGGNQRDEEQEGEALPCSF